MIYDKCISANVKSNWYKTVVRPAIIYGLKRIPLTKKPEAELEVEELKMLYVSMGVTIIGKIKNK